MNNDILRYSAFGAHYRLYLYQVARLDSRDFYKFLATVCNQETHEKRRRYEIDKERRPTN